MVRHRLSVKMSKGHNRTVASDCYKANYRWMITSQEAAIDTNERRRRALARLESTGNLDAVARAFNITPADLAAWAAEADEPARFGLNDRQGKSTVVDSDRFARWRKPEPPLQLPSFVAAAVGVLPLAVWPLGALWAVIGGFTDFRNSADAWIFGWTLVLYPVVYVPCMIVFAMVRRRMPRLAFGVALLPCLQALVCVAAFAYGLELQASASHR